MPTSRRADQVPKERVKISILSPEFPRDSLGRFYSYIPRAKLEAAYRSAGEWALLEIDEEMGGGFDKVPTRWLLVTARRGG